MQRTAGLNLAEAGTNVAGLALSGVATLTVLVPPTIVTQPVSRAVALGSTVSLSVAASGTAPLYYQWRKGDRQQRLRQVIQRVVISLLP